MSPSPSSSRTRVVGLSLALGVYALLGGLSSLAGWMFDLPRLTDWDGNGISIQPNTTVCAAVAGLGLIGLALERRRIAVFSGLVLVVIGGATIFEYISGVNLGIDTPLMFGREWGRVGVLSPGRMGPPGVTSWTLIGVALVLRASTDRLARVAFGIVSVITGISMLSLVGYAYGVDVLYTLPRLTVIAFQTATFIFAVSVGLAATMPHGLPAMFWRDDAAGVLVRRVGLPLLIIPFSLGWLRLAGQRAGFYDTSFGAALQTIAHVIFLAALLWWTAKAIARLEDARSAVEAVRDKQSALLRQANAEVLAKEAELHLITVTTPVILIRCSRDCRYRFINPAGEAHLKRPAHELIGQLIIESIGQEAFDGIKPYIDRVLAGEPVEFEALVPYAASGPRWMRAFYIPDRGTDGEIIGWIASLTDVTDRREAEERLRDNDRRKDEFLATLAHELRNPLAPIKTAAHLLRNHDASQASLQSAHDILDRQLGHLLRLVDDLLDVSRVTRGTVSLQRQPIDISFLVASAVETTRSVIDSRRQHLAVVVPAEGVSTYGDPVRLIQVLANILDNASKYTPSGGHITVECTLDQADVIITVTDDGNGIPPEQLDDVFGLFTRLESSSTGLGIGLHLAKRFVELHEGTIHAYSEGRGKGTRIVLRLPALAAEVQGRTAHLRGGCGAKELRIGRSRRVLVVDDNVDAVTSLTLWLEQNGHVTQSAFDGADGVARALAWSPDVILLDIGLPNLDGYDTCRAIRKELSGRSTRIIALTGWGQPEDRARSRAAGFDAHLVKPVDLAVLHQMLAES